MHAREGVVLHHLLRVAPLLARHLLAGVGIRATRCRCRSDVAHIRQSRPDSGLDVQVKFLTTFFSLSSLGSGWGYRNVQRFRGGLVFKARRLLYHSTLGLESRKKRRDQGVGSCPVQGSGVVRTGSWTGPPSER